jgi:hypothetical protein
LGQLKLLYLQSLLLMLHFANDELSLLYFFKLKVQNYIMSK